MLAIARLIRTVTLVAVAIIVVAIALWVLSANPHKVVVSDIHDAGKWLASPFVNIFGIKGAKLHLAVNWGLAAVVYLIVGGFLARLAARSAAGMGGGYGRRFGRFGRPRPVV